MLEGKCPDYFGCSQGSRPYGIPGCMTFVRGTDVRTVLAGLGVDQDDAMPPSDPEFESTPGITVIRAGEWLVALETAAWPRGIRPDIQRRLSVGTEVVVVFEDIGKGNHELAHAADGEIITAVTTCMPTPHWQGTQPDRLRPLAEELGMESEDDSPGVDTDLLDIEILLLLAETAFGLSLDEADLDNPLLKVPDEPPDPAPRRPASAAPAAVDSELVRSHVQHLVDRGVSIDTIAEHTVGMPATWVVRLLDGKVGPWVGAGRANQILAIEVPPSAEAQ